MRELNIDFLDLYKRVDRFIRDAYASSEGVSEYLRQMEQNDFKGRNLVPAWAKDYLQLKRLRWIRNQLSHEVGYDAELCEEADYLWMEEFRRRLYDADDPLALLRRAEHAERQRSIEEQRRHQAQRQKQQAQAALQQRQQAQAALQQRQQAQAALRQREQPRPAPQQTQQPIAPGHKSLWARLKNWFAKDKN